MASAQPGVWGIDLGQCALKAIRLQVKDGEVVATAFDYIEHPKILSQPDADPDQLTRAALEQFLSRNQLRGDQIAISVAGQTGLARFVKLPPVEAKKIPEIVKFEAKQQIPFPLEEVVWDWQSLGTAGETEGFVENEIGLFAMKRDMVARSLQAYKEVGVEVHFVQMAPLALCNFVAYDIFGKGSGDSKAGAAAADQPPADEELTARNACVVTLDIGCDNTNLVVTDGERIIWQRPIPIGGNHFTRALTKDMKLTFAKAEHLKRNATKAEDPKKIFQSMKPVFSDFVGELQRSLGFFTNTHRQAQIKKLIGLGNAFRLPGLQKFISQSMSMELEKLSSFRRLTGDEVLNSPVYGENVLSFSVAYGLALQGLALTRLHTNLLPQEIQLERVVRAKKPWVAASAASILLGVGILAIASGSQFQVSDAAAKAAANAKKVMEEHSRYENEFRQKQDELKRAREAAAAMMRGGEERANWANTLRYINECLPQPNGVNVPARYLSNGQMDPNCALALYWNSGARRAADRLRELVQEGLRDETSLSDLIQINTQAIYARYCDPAMATAFFNNVKDPKNGAQIREPLDHPDWKKAPDKAGWAIEIRGYTYHDKGVRFVMDTFMDNLRTGKPRKFDAEKKQWVLEKGVIAPLNDPASRWVKLDISHVAILCAKTDILGPGKNPDFEYIRGGLFLNNLVKAASGAGGGTGGNFGAGLAPGGPGAPGGDAGGAGRSSVRGDWVGIGDAVSSGGSGAPGGGYPGAPGGGGGLGLPPGGPPGPGGASGNTATGEAKPLKSGERKRTEFVIVLYWDEPLPTEPEPVKGERDYAEANSGGYGGDYGGIGGYPGGGYPGGDYPGGGGAGGGDTGGMGDGGRGSGKGDPGID